MKGFIKTSGLCVLVCYSSFALAGALSPKHFPSELMYLNKPIDPLCLFDLESDGTVANINLKKCGIIKNRYQVAGHNKTLAADGFYGFDWKDPSVDYPSGGFSYYKAWAQGPKSFWVYSANNSGGSGDFTSLGLLTRKDQQTISFQTVAGGDRCNGGVSDVNDNNGLQYGINLTAYDVVSLGKVNGLRAYDDLSSCAACCVAKAFYNVNASLEPKLLYVDLGKDKLTAAGQGKYDACFNTLVNGYISQGTQKLNADELNQFAKAFKKNCIK